MDVSRLKVCVIVTFTIAQCFYLTLVYIEKSNKIITIIIVGTLLNGGVIINMQMYIPLIQPIFSSEFMHFNCLLEKHLLHDIGIKMSSFVGLSKTLHIKCTIIINFFTYVFEDLVKKQFGIVNVLVCYYIHYFEA